MERLMGRQKEKRLLQEAIESGKRELIALLDKAYADNLENKRDVFREQTKKIYLFDACTHIQYQKQCVFEKVSTKLDNHGSLI